MSELEGRSLGKLMVPPFSSLAYLRRPRACPVCQAAYVLLSLKQLNCEFCWCTSLQLLQPWCRHHWEALTFSLSPRVTRFNTRHPGICDFQMNNHHFLVEACLKYSRGYTHTKEMCLCASGYPTFIFPFTLIGPSGPSGIWDDSGCDRYGARCILGCCFAAYYPKASERFKLYLKRFAFIYLI